MTRPQKSFHWTGRDQWNDPTPQKAFSEMDAIGEMIRPPKKLSLNWTRSVIDFVLTTLCRRSMIYKTFSTLHTPFSQEMSIKHVVKNLWSLANSSVQEALGKYDYFWQLLIMFGVIPQYLDYKFIKVNQVVCIRGYRSKSFWRIIRSLCRQKCMWK